MEKTRYILSALTAGLMAAGGIAAKDVVRSERHVERSRARDGVPGAERPAGAPRFAGLESAGQEWLHERSHERFHERFHARPEASRACTLYPSFNCHGVAREYGRGRQVVYAVDMNHRGHGYRRMDVFVRLCDPSGWVLHLADSPAADAQDGEHASTDRHAQAILHRGTRFDMLSSLDRIHGLSPARVSLGSVVPATGCSTLQMTAYHAPGASESYLLLENPSTGEPATVFRSTHGMKLGPPRCSSPGAGRQHSAACDRQEREEPYLWYIAVHRTVGSSARRGSGVSSACMVLDSDIRGPVASCL